MGKLFPVTHDIGCDCFRYLGRLPIRSSYEPKLDGFRALAYVTGHRCDLVSRNGQRFKSWPQLAEEIAHAVKAHSAASMARCCLESDGRPNFHSLMFRRMWPCGSTRLMS